MQDEGVVVIGLGEKARREAELCVESLRRSNGGLEVKVITPDFSPASQPAAKGEGNESRWVKVNLDRLTPFEETLYLDADTRVNLDVGAGFEMLEDGWELVIGASEHQGEDILWHVEKDERRKTVEELGYTPLQLQGGVFFFRKCERVSKFFEVWREEWGRWGDQDQAALLRALNRQPVRVWMLGKPWVNGAVVAHLFGRCR